MYGVLLVLYTERAASTDSQEKIVSLDKERQHVVFSVTKELVLVSI